MADFADSLFKLKNLGFHTQRLTSNTIFTSLLKELQPPSLPQLSENKSAKIQRAPLTSSASLPQPSARPSQAKKPPTISISPPQPIDTTTTTSMAEDVKTPAPEHAIGKLFVNIIEARNLNVSQPMRARPYCVVEFDKNQLTTCDALRQDHNPIGIPIPNARAKPIDYMKMAKDASCPRWKHEAVFDVTRTDSEITVSVYDHGNLSAAGEDTFLGTTTIKPMLVHKRAIENWFKLSPRGTETVSGDVRVQLLYEVLENRAKLTPANFHIGKLVGRGSFGKVYQVRKHDTSRVYAMKVLSKRSLIERKEVAHTISERNVLIQSSNSPFIVGLKFSFQTPEHLYLVMDYMSGGELFWHLQREKTFSEERARFYCAELVLALEHLHKFGVVYRDLKPENVLLDSTGHVTLTDFGLCKENVHNDETTSTFCGTSEYLAPEVLMGKAYGKAVDWWSLGILMYECMTGWPPFYADDINVLYQKILTSRVKFPASMSNEAKDLIKKLLDRDPVTRLGSGPADAAEVRAHPFFASIEWDKVLRKQVPPPFKPPTPPSLIEEVDHSSFDSSRASLDFSASLPRATPLSNTWQMEFKGFSYGKDDASVRSIVSKRTTNTLGSSVDSMWD